MRRIVIEEKLSLYYMYYGVNPGYRIYLKTMNVQEVKCYLKSKHRLGCDDLFISLNGDNVYHTLSDVEWMINRIRKTTNKVDLKVWESYLFHKNSTHVLEVESIFHPLTGVFDVEIYVYAYGLKTPIHEYIMQ